MKTLLPADGIVMSTNGNGTVLSIGCSGTQSSLNVTGTATIGTASIATLTGAAMTAITNSIATKQATIPQNLSLQTGFVGIWDSFNTIMKGLVCTAPLLVTSASAYLGLALSTMQCRRSG